MATFQVIDSWTGRQVLRPQVDDLPEGEHPHTVQHTFWVIDDEGNLYIADGRHGVYYDPPAGKYEVKFPQEE